MPRTPAEHWYHSISKILSIEKTPFAEANDVINLIILVRLENLLKLLRLLQQSLLDAQRYCRLL